MSSSRNVFIIFILVSLSFPGLKNKASAAATNRKLLAPPSNGFPDTHSRTIFRGFPWYPGYTNPGYNGYNYPGYTYPGYTYPGSIFPGNTYPGYNYPGSTFPGNTYPGYNYPGNNYPGVEPNYPVVEPNYPVVEPNYPENPVIPPPETNNRH